MILEIDSTLEKFKKLEFSPGLNVLLADTSDPDATGKTRNSAGKSSTVQIIDFLLGSSAGIKSLFRSEALIEVEFSGRIQVGEEVLSVARSGSDPSKVFLENGGGVPDDILNDDKETGRQFVKIANWRRFLGNRYFGLPLTTKSGDFSRKYAPTYRALIKYFLRSATDGGFSSPESNAKSQQPYSVQGALSYVFGLEWRIAQELEGIRDRERALKALKNVAGLQGASEMVGTVAQLRGRAAVATRNAQTKRKEIANFEVLETYKETADRAAELRIVLQDISRRLVSSKETLRYLENAYEGERPAYELDVLSMYQASGVELPDVALRRFEDVEAFQRSVTSNRKLHLDSEIQGVRRQIDNLGTELGQSSDLRRELLLSLDGKGAFEDLVVLQVEAAELEAEAARQRELLETAEALESDKSELKVQRLEIKKRLQTDHTTHSKRLDELILRVAELISKLYINRDGFFEVSATENGPEFSIHIEGDRGTGIRSMEIFCMDVAIYEAVHRRYTGPGFLIHDSDLFDPVDVRQIAQALKIGRDMAGKTGQYIVTMNSDVFSTLPFGEELDADEIVAPVRLSDKDDESGLFGFRFE